MHVTNETTKYFCSVELIASRVNLGQPKNWMAQFLALAYYIYW